MIFEHKPLSLQDLMDRLVVTKEKLLQVLTRTDNYHKFIKELMWKTQSDERQQGFCNVPSWDFT